MNGLDKREGCNRPQTESSQGTETLLCILKWPLESQEFRVTSFVSVEWKLLSRAALESRQLLVN